MILIQDGAKYHTSKATRAFFEAHDAPFPEAVAVDEFRRSFLAYGVSGTPSFVLVNAAGAWVNELLQHVQPAPAQLDVDMVQGTHIVMPGRLQQGLYYLEAPEDRRAIFAMPWQGNIMVGTTESLFQGDPAQVRPL